MALTVTDSILLGASSSLVRPVVVLDTMAVINSACYRVSTGHPGRLEQVIHWPIPVTLLAPRHVIEEVDRHLAARAVDEDLDPTRSPAPGTSGCAHTSVWSTSPSATTSTRGCAGSWPTTWPLPPWRCWSPPQWCSATTAT
jgi:hypothetical protein